MIGGLFGRLKKAEKYLRDNPLRTRSGADPHAYAGRPVEYAEKVLKVTLTPDQKLILQALHQPPYRVMVPSGHNVGKTFIAAVAVCYWYDSYDPGVVLTTAPTHRDVVDLLWTEVRLLRQRAGLASDFIGPAAPEMRSSEDHYAKGFTAVKGESFQGRHRQRMLFVKDEASGVGPLYWITTRTMFDASAGHAELNIFNPTDTTSMAYLEDQAPEDDQGNPRHHRFQLSALNHPNIAAELRGEPKPIPGAVGLSQVKEWVRDWCEPINKEPVFEEADKKATGIVATDVEWPPESGVYYRPGPIFQSRALGLWPDTGAGVWSDALWTACLRPRDYEYSATEHPQIGCDTATGKGDDYHAIHGRWCNVSVHHETANTMDPARILGRLKSVAALLADLRNKHFPRYVPLTGKDIPIKVDDDGTGGALASLLLADGYTVAAIGAGCRAGDQAKYPRRRDELWFQGADRAKLGMIYVGGLDRQTQQRLKQQLMAPAWGMDAAGRRCVESKDDTKLKIGRSPDDADAFNLAYLEGVEFRAPEQVEAAAVPAQSMAERRGLFGRG